MNKDLAVIIGVGPGLGLALTKTFHGQGFEVCMIARNVGKLDSYIQELNSGPGKAYSYGADVSDKKSLKSTMEKILQEHGTPKLVIYNVSLLRPAVPMDISYDSFIEDFKINVAGMLTAFQSLFPSMNKKGEGKILITGGGLSLSPYFEFTSLGVGKAGLRNLACSLAQATKDSGVEVYTITINGMIKEKTKFDPALIADEFLKVYQNGLTPGEFEFVFE